MHTHAHTLTLSHTYLLTPSQCDLLQNCSNLLGTVGKQNELYQALELSSNNAVAVAQSRKPLSFQLNTTQPPTTPWTSWPMRGWNLQCCGTSISIFNAGVENKLISRRRPRSSQHPRKGQRFLWCSWSVYEVPQIPSTKVWWCHPLHLAEALTWRRLSVTGWSASLFTLYNPSDFQRANGEGKAIDDHPQLMAVL